MIEQQTVLILGAGASVDYDFPMGPTLRKKIIGGTAPNNGIANQLLKLGHSPEHIRDFREAFEQSPDPSIDAFLGNRTDFIEIGKQTIASALIPFEIKEKVYRLEEQRWYDFLWERITENRTDPRANQLSILTFNYDRSLEYFLYLGLRNSYEWNDNQIADFFTYVPVIHLYGQLGLLPFQHGGRYKRAYDGHVNLDVTRDAATEIRIIHEGQQKLDDPEFTWAVNKIQEARKVCFLGFGFNLTNIKRLPLHMLNQDAYIYGTAYGLGQGEASLATQRIRERTKRQNDDRIMLGGRSEDCLELLKHLAFLA